MDTFEHTEQEQAGEDFEVEFTDLDPPESVGSSKSFGLESTLLHWQRSPNRRRWSLASSVGIVLLLVILFSLSNVLSSPLVKSFRTALFPPSHSASSARDMPTSPRQDDIACLADAAWSPDGNLVAVLGYFDCPENGYALGMVNLYDARSRKLVNRLEPDEAILRVLDGPVSPPRRQFGIQPQPGDQGEETTPLIYYAHVTWSPDGQRLALTFEIATQWLSMPGVVLINRDGGNVRVLLQQHAPTQLYAEWDVDEDRPVTLSTPSLPPALSYHWGTNGTLVPEILLSKEVVPAAHPPLAGPVGNPDGNNSFTIWQAGLANFISLADTSSVSNMYTWSTDFAAWSPDGRYLIDGIALAGLLKPPGQLFPSHKALVASGMDQAPLLPIHDAALLRVVDSATAIAWSPNGRVLAAYSAGNIVNLYDCSDGYRLASFVLHTKYAAPPAHAVIMRWSPGGSLLLLSSVAWGLVSIWAPNSKQLPR